MGRFYQTYSPVFLDNKMLKLPYEVMGNVIGKVDQDIQQQETAVFSLYDKLQANALKQDQPRLREVLSGYEGEIDTLAGEMQKDPMSFRKKATSIRDLGRKLHEDFTRGEVASIQGNFNALQDYQKRTRERVKKGDVLQSDMELSVNKALSEFGGTNFGTENNVLNLEELNKFVNLEDISEERAKGYVAKIVDNIQGYVHNGYIYEDETKTKRVGKDKIFTGVYSAMLNDKELTDYLKQQKSLGAMSDSEIEAAVFNAADRVAEKYSVDERKTSRKLKADPFALARYRSNLKKEEERVFTPTFDISKPIIPKEDFNHSSTTNYLAATEQKVTELKEQDTSAMSPEQLKSHSKKIEYFDAKRVSLQSMRDQAEAETMHRLAQEGKIPQEQYEKFLAYQENTNQVDTVVSGVLDEMNSVLQDPNLSGKAKDAIRQSVLNSKLSSDPEFAEAWDQYMSKEALYKMNEGDYTKIFDGLSWEHQEPNKEFDKWYESNKKFNVQHNKVLSLAGEGNEDFRSTLDDVVLLSSGDSRPMSVTETTFKDGVIQDAEIEGSIDTGFFSETNFTPDKVAKITGGKKMSEVFNLVGIQPSGTGLKVIYQYDKDKASQFGDFDEIEGLEDGQAFAFALPDTGIEGYTKEKFETDKNPQAASIAHYANNKLFHVVTDRIEKTIQDINVGEFEPGPKNTIYLDGLKLNITKEQRDGRTFYNINGKDLNNNKNLNTGGHSSNELARQITNYLETRDKL